MKPGLGERRFLALCRLLPRGFREAFGAELLELFRYRRDQQLGSHGRLGLYFWRFVVSDALRTAWAERWPGSPSTRRRSGTMRGWLDDFSYAIRRLRNSPGFAATAVAILVFGVGVTTAAFSVVNSLLLQPPPFEDPDRVVALLQSSDDGRPSSTSFPAYQDIARQESLFESVAASSTTEAFLGEPEALSSILVEYATAGYLDVLGLSPHQGRWFDGPEDDASGPPAAVVTYRYWRDRLGADPDVLGSTIRISGASVTVVGVGPSEYGGGRGPVPVDYWLSISSMAPTGGPAFSLTRRQDHPFTVRARLRAGVTMPEVEAGMNQLADALAATYPDINAERRIHVIPTANVRFDPAVDGQLVPVAALLMAVAGLVLFIATLNLANLLLVRTHARAREMAVRLAIGAGRWRLVRVVLSEALLLSAAGGVGGVLAAMWLFRALERMPVSFGLPITLDIDLDRTVLLFALCVSVATGLLFGLIPALRATSRDANATLRDESADSLGGRRRVGLTGVLVAGQIAMSMLLLSVGAVFLESLLVAGRSDPGFAYERSAYTQISLQPLDLSAEEAAIAYREIEDRIEALPGVEQATFALQLPARLRGTTTQLLGSGMGGVDRPTEIPWNVVGSDYFEVMDVPLVHGRTFVEADRAGAPVVVISEAMARAYWGRSDVVGEPLRSENNPDDPSEIVGVVADAAVRALGEEPTPSLYWLYTAGAAGRGTLLFRTTGSPGAALPSVRSAIHSVDPRILQLSAGTLEAHLGETLVRQKLAARMLVVLGGLALGLALLGIYGLVSYAVTQRRREVGIRLALGAGRASVVALFMRNVALVVVLGAAVGTALAYPIGSVVGRSFVGQEPNAWMMAALAAALAATAILATLIPAARAARTDPREALARE